MRSCPGFASGSPSCGGILDLAARQARLEELQRAAADPPLWEDRERAEKTLREQRDLERALGFLAEIDKLAADADALDAMVSINARAGGTDSQD